MLNSSRLNPFLNHSKSAHFILWVCLGLFAFSTQEHCSLLGCQRSECEAPGHEDGERLKEEIVVSSTARQRLNQRQHQKSGTADKTIPAPVCSYPVPDNHSRGHLLSNGLFAPLLI